MSRVLLSIGAVQVVVVLVALVRAKVLSVLLGPADFGIVSTIDQIVATAVAIGAVCLPVTALKFMARSHSEGQGAFQQTYAGFVHGLVVLGVGTTALLLALVAIGPETFGEQLAPWRGAIAVAALGVPAAMLTILFVNTLAAAQRASAAAVAGLATSGALAVGAVLGELANGITGLYVGVVIAGAVGSGAVLLYLRARLGVHPGGRVTTLVAELRRSPQIVSFSLLLYVAMAAYSLTMLGVRLSVLATLGEVEAGLLQALLSLALTVGAVMAAMGNLSLVPFVNRNVPVAAKVAAADDFARRMAVLLVLVAMPLVLFPRLAIVTLFTDRFLAAASVLSLFVVWQCAHQLANVYLQLLLGLDDVAWFSGIMCAGYACTALALLALVPRFGLAGAAAALTTGAVVMGAGAAARLRLRFAAGVSRATTLRTAACLASLALGGVLPVRAGEGTLAGLLVRAAYVLAVAAVFWTLLSGDERGVVRGALVRLRSRRRAVGISS